MKPRSKDYSIIKEENQRERKELNVEAWMRYVREIEWASCPGNVRQKRDRGDDQFSFALDSFLTSAAEEEGFPDLRSSASISVRSFKASVREDLSSAWDCSRSFLSLEFST